MWTPDQSHPYERYLMSTVLYIWSLFAVIIRSILKDFWDFLRGFSQCEVRYWSWARRSGVQSAFQFIPVVFNNGVEFFHFSRFGHECRTVWESSTYGCDGQVFESFQLYNVYNKMACSIDLSSTFPRFSHLAD